MVDDHDSPVHSVSCSSSNPLSCHMLHHTACMLLKDCHFEQYVKLGGATACFDTGIPPAWNWESFIGEILKVVQWSKNQMAMIQNNSITFAEKILRAKYRNGRISFTFCALCIFVSLFSFIRRLKEFYPQTSGRICFFTLCVLLHLPFYYYSEHFCRMFSCQAHLTVPSAMSPLDWFYISNNFFARIYLSFVALPIALLGLFRNVECTSLFPMLKRHRRALDVQFNAHQREFFSHLSFLLLVASTCFSSSDGLDFFFNSFVLYDFFGFLMMVMALTNAIGVIIFADGSEMTDATGEQHQISREVHIWTTKDKAIRSIFIIFVLVSFFLPPIVNWLVILASSSDLRKEDAGIGSKDTKSSSTGWKCRVDFSGECLMPVDWNHLDRRLNSFQRAQWFYFMLALLFFAASNFEDNKLNVIFANIYKNILCFISMSFFCEFFARACTVCERIFFFQRIWVTLLVWVSFSMAAEFLLTLISDGAPPGPYICMIIQTFLLYSVCNISHKQPDAQVSRLQETLWTGLLWLFWALLLLISLIWLFVMLYETIVQQLSHVLAFAACSIFAIIFILIKQKCANLTINCSAQPVASLLAISHLVNVIFCLQSIHSTALTLPGELIILTKVAAALSMFLLCTSNRLVFHSLLGFVFAVVAFQLFDGTSIA